MGSVFISPKTIAGNYNLTLTLKDYNEDSPQEQDYSFQIQVYDVVAGEASIPEELRQRSDGLPPSF